MFPRGSDQGRTALDEAGDTSDGAHAADCGEVAATGLFKCFDTRCI